MIAALHRLAALVAVALLAAGCANFSAISPGDSALQLASAVGKPATVWSNPDGSEVWEYPEGPTGVQTFMVDIGQDQAVHAVHQVLSEEYFSRVNPGMSREEVRRLLGRPKEIWYFPDRDEESWTWRYLDVRYKFFHALFDRPSGQVRYTLRLDEVFPPGGRGRH